MDVTLLEATRRITRPVIELARASRGSVDSFTHTHTLSLSLTHTHSLPASESLHLIFSHSLVSSLSFRALLLVYSRS
jgi:hypothetical protein